MKDLTTYMMCKGDMQHDLERSFNSLWHASEQRRFVVAIEKKVAELRSRIGEPPVECRCCGEKDHISGLCYNCAYSIGGKSAVTAFFARANA